MCVCVFVCMRVCVLCNITVIMQLVRWCAQVESIRITVHNAPLLHLSNYLVTCETHEQV